MRDIMPSVSGDWSLLLLRLSEAHWLLARSRSVALREVEREPRSLHYTCIASQSEARMEAADQSQSRDSVLPKRPHCDEPLSPLSLFFAFNSVSHSSCLFTLILTHLPKLHFCGCMILINGKQRCFYYIFEESFEKMT